MNTNDKHEEPDQNKYKHDKQSKKEEKNEVVMVIIVVAWIHLNCMLATHCLLFGQSVTHC